MSTQKSGFSVRKIARWLVLAVLVIVIVLFLKKPQPLAEPMSAQVVQQKVEEFQGKVRDLQQSHQQGVTSQAQFTTEEINAVVERSGRTRSSGAGGFYACQPSQARGNRLRTTAGNQARTVHVCR